MENSSSNQRQIQHPATREGDQDTGSSTSEQSQIQHPATREGDQDTGTSTSEQSQVQHPATREGDQDTGTSTSEQSQIQHPATREGDQDTGTSTSEQSQIQHPATREGDQDTGTSTSEQSQIQHPATREGDQDTGTSTSEQSQIQHPATREGDQDTGTSTREQSQIQHPATREGDQDTGSSTSEQSQIQHPATREGDQDTGTSTSEQSQIQHPATREGDQDTGTSTREQSQIQHPATREGDQDTGTSTSEQSQIQHPATREGDQDTGTSTSEQSQIQHPATREGDQDTGTSTSEQSQIQHPATREGDQDTGSSTSEQSQIQHPATREGDQDTGTSTSEQSQIQHPATREGDQDTGTSTREQSQIQHPATREGDQDTGTSTSEQSQIQHPATREGDQDTGTSTSEQSQIQHPATREGDQDTGTSTSEQSQIQHPATSEGDQDTGTSTREQSQIQHPATREGDQDTGTSTSEQSQIQHPATREGDQDTGTSTREATHSPRDVILENNTSIERNTDPNSTITDFLTKCDDYQLFKLMKFYRDRLEQAIEEGVEGLSLILKEEDHFTGQEHQKITELVEKGNRADSSKLLLNLVMEKDSRVQRLMWKSFVKMCHRLPKLYKMLKEIQELDCDSFDYMDIARSLSEIPSHLKDVQQKHKETLRVQTETLRVNTILIKEKVKIFQLVDRYAELTVISTVRDRTLVEHELLARGRDHEEWRKKHLQKKLEKIRTDQLLQSSFSHRKSKSGISAAVSGVPGIGKTTMVQKIVYDWATGKIYPHFQFVFSFKFRDLNSINCRINLRNLILDQYPYFGNILGELWKNPEGLLFIFDGLDESKDTIDFDDNRRNTEPQYICTDPECCCEVSDIVYSLIQHKLLPGCSVLVTSRPTALHLLEKAEISVWTEILGFVGDEQKEYFNKFFEDQTVAAAVFKHVEENEILYTMCYNPSYCWILCLSLGPFFTQRDRKQQQVPKTITQLYSYYIYNILKNHGREIENPHDVLLKIGEMAFTGVSRKKIVFRNGDLIEYNLQPSQFLSGFLMELLERDDSVQSVVYTFPHLTIQEFVAALAQFLTAGRGDIRNLLSDAHRMKDGRFEIFLRFVAGLSSPQAARPLEEFLGPFIRQTTCRVIDWVKEKVEGAIGNTESETGKRKLLNTLHYLFESQNKPLARVTVGSVDTLTFNGLQLTPIDCAVLSHVIGLCDTIKKNDLEYCNIPFEGLQRLGPVLHKCQELRLGFNNLGDSGVKLLSAALRNPDCKIQELGLEVNNLTASCIEDLASALSTNRSLTVLDMGGNNLGDSGVKLLSEALRNPDCKIQRLELYRNKLTASCIEDLTSALSTNRSLTDLNLSDNKLGDSGVKLLSAALRNTDCKIQKLSLSDVCLTDSCAEDLASALSALQSLTFLNLTFNSFTDQSVPALHRLIVTCRSLERIWLRQNQFTLTGMNQLTLLQDTRPRLDVAVDVPFEFVTITGLSI
ncbi:NACHT, LRR and PYD domains-containing protein 3-like [Heterodontus francisci]|uniref:NACHT, LRR and PYD domains-containing protein 3-like n=1 Tax=Heterodontus francisci TaxID=7792 RepID=UPI00355C8029